MDRYRRELEQLVNRTGSADPNSPLQVAAERYRQFRVRLGMIEMERLEAEVTVGILDEARRRDGPAATAATPESIARRAFLADPEVAGLVAMKKRAEAAAEAARHLARSPSDAAVVHQRHRAAEAQAEIDQLWAERRDEFLALTADAAGPLEAGDRMAEHRAAELRLAKLRGEEKRLRDEVEQIHGESRTEGSDTLRAQFVSSELNSATELYRRVSLMLEQLQAEAHGPAQISPISEARPPLKPSRDPRLTLMAVAPVGWLLALVGLFTLVEARAARVADPDDLGCRLRLDVLGVVPPLPAARAPRQARALDDHRRHFHEYVQSLDHLRVTLCSPTRGGGRRCIMITSAHGGEGKTTLATQLAGRCANAGLNTLLVDADLRKPSLGQLLEVSDSPGLCEVLAGDLEAEAALVPIGRAGGFHLLPAGAGHDPSRILQGDRLGELIGRLRALYDVVIIDVPPILPVPDALLVGHWVDGAVLAVRHGISRVPLVERAHRRLTSLGVPVFGAVVNGCRPTESAYYGHYAYGVRGAGGAAPEAV
jgi:capsular exopolysaccharide synthesis family protein